MRITGKLEGRSGPIWRGINIPLEQYGGSSGTTSFLPDHLALRWWHVPFEWRVAVGGQLEERYVWGKGCRWLQREVRQIAAPGPDETGISGWYRDPNVAAR